MVGNATQQNTATQSSKNRRETVEVLPSDSSSARQKFPKTHVNFWRGRLRRQRYGSKADGTYREAPAFYVRINHQGREHAFTFRTLNETAAATNARDIYLSILKEGWETVLRKHQSSAVQAVENPTVGQFLEDVSAKAGLRARTFRNYASCFRTIITYNLSYNTVAAELGPAGEFAGFSVASPAQVLTLWENAGIPGNGFYLPSSSAWQTILNFNQLIDPAANNQITAFSGPADYSSDTTQSSSIYSIYVDGNSGLLVASPGPTEYNLNTSEYNIGTWLVMTVPEPSVWSLVAFGTFIAFAGKGRRNKSIWEPNRIVFTVMGKTGTNEGTK